MDLIDNLIGLSNACNCQGVDVEEQDRPTVEQVESLLTQLDPDLLGDFLARNIVVSRLALIPAYRHESIFGRPLPCRYSLNILASGVGVTDREGQAVIPAGRLLECLRAGEPVHPGLHPVSGSNKVPSDGLFLTGGPITVVTSADESPAIFTARSDDVPQFGPAGVQRVALSWQTPAPNLGSSDFDAMKVRVRSFQPDGTISASKVFAWHLTMECVLDFNLA